MKRYRFLLLIFLIMWVDAASLQNLDRQCQKKSAKACHDLGYLYDQKGKVKKAAALYKRACALHHAMGCYRLAELYLVGSGVPQSDASFITYTQKACTLGYKESCTFTQQAKPSTKISITSPKKLQKKKPYNISIKVPTLGTLKVHVKQIDKQKRTIQIDASMTNLLGQASGWLSFSFPDIRHNALLKSDTKGFDHIRAYPEGSSIYHIKQKKAISSRYLLVEGEAKHWPKKRTNKASITLKIPPEVEVLTLYIRGAFKRGKQVKSLPKKGSAGQQGFYNAILRIPIGAIRQKTSTRKPHNTSKPIAPVISTLPEQILTRRDKLLLLDQLLSLSYFHRERKTFEKQLKETLFGGAKYLTYIKGYHCKPRNGGRRSRCTLRLAGQTSKGNRAIRWEFHVEFTAKKENGIPKITEMHSLDLLE